MFFRIVRSGFSSPIVLQRSFHKIGVVGVPFNKGQTKNGVDKGPDALRESGLLEHIHEICPKADIKDYGNITYSVKNESCDIKKLKNWAHVAECNQQLSNQVFNIIKDGRVCLTLGGDHSIAIGTVDGHIRTCEPGKFALIWIDAHADININTSSPTGNVHGMPVAFLAKELRSHWPPTLPYLEWQRPQLLLNKLAYIGLRSVDYFERDVIDKYGVAAFDMKDVQIYGIHNVIRMALNKIDPDSNCSLHVSFDIDSLDALEAPSTGTPVRGGLTLREGMEIMETVCDTGRMQALDIVEVNPLIGTNRDVFRTLEAAKEIVSAAFGHKRKGLKL